MHRFLHFFRILVIIVLGFVVTASCLILILGLSNTERWESYTTQKNESSASMDSTAKPEEENQYKTPIHVSATALAPKPLATWPPETEDFQSP